METDKQAVYNVSNNVGRELFVDMDTEDLLTERMMDIEAEEEDFEDEEPIDNSQE